MTKRIEEFHPKAQAFAESAGYVWEDLTDEQRDLLVAFVIKEYYEANPEELKEILDGEDENSV